MPDLISLLAAAAAGESWAIPSSVKPKAKFKLDKKYYHVNTF
jgi:hypothetical protein